MLWCTTSAVATSSRAMRSPSGSFMLSAMSRLPRWHPMKEPTTAPRMPSPRVGSTLMTSAPKSAISIGPNGPAKYWPKSMTRIPSSGPGISNHPFGAQRGQVIFAAPERAQHFVGVGARPGLGTPHLPGCRLEEDHRPQLRQRAQVGVVHLHHRVGRPELGVLEALLRAHDRLGPE